MPARTHVQSEFAQQDLPDAGRSRHVFLTSLSTIFMTWVYPHLRLRALTIDTTLPQSFPPTNVWPALAVKCFTTGWRRISHGYGSMKTGDRCRGIAQCGRGLCWTHTSVPRGTYADIYRPTALQRFRSIGHAKTRHRHVYSGPDMHAMS